MLPNKEYIEYLELDKFDKDIDRIENQELDLIFDPLFDCVCPRKVYEKMQNMMEWECAVCGERILIDKRRNDVENFVCERCREVHNNKNNSIDRRILESRNRMYKQLEDRLYEELESNLFS